VSSRSTEILAKLASLGPRLRGAVGDGVLTAVFRALVTRGKDDAPGGMPLRPDPAAPSYWTKRGPETRGRERYEKAY
jgi:hypothetical protein